MDRISIQEIMETKLNGVEEQLLHTIQEYKAFNREWTYPNLCNDLNMVPITISKALKRMTEKGIIEKQEGEVSLTLLGMKFLKYMQFRDEIISEFLKVTKNDLSEKQYLEKMRAVIDYPFLINLKNTINQIKK